MTILYRFQIQQHAYQKRGKDRKRETPTQSIGKRGNSWPNRENWAEWVTSKMVTHDNNQHRMYDIIHTCKSQNPAAPIPSFQLTKSAGVFLYMKHSAGFAILQGQSSLCRMIEISKLSKVDDPFTKHPGMWWTRLAPTERELSYETQHLTNAWKQKFADAGGSSRCFCFESSLWQKKMKNEERRIPKKRKACRIFLRIYWSSDSTADTLIPWSDLAIHNCHSSPPLLLSWQQPSESPKTPQISPASPNLATPPSKTTRPKNLPSQSQQNSWWNNSWWKTISCETQKIIPRISSKAYMIFYLSFWACPLANFRSSSTYANSFETIDNPWFGPQWWDLTDPFAMGLRQICMKNWRIFQFPKNPSASDFAQRMHGGGWNLHFQKPSASDFVQKNWRILHFPKIICASI